MIRVTERKGNQEYCLDGEFDRGAHYLWYFFSVHTMMTIEGMEGIQEKVKEGGEIQIIGEWSSMQKQVYTD